MSLKVIVWTLGVTVLMLAVLWTTMALSQSCWACMHGCTEAQRLCKCFNECVGKPSVMDLPGSLRALAYRESEKHRADTLNAAANKLDRCRQ